MSDATALPRPLAYGCLALSMALVGSYVALSKPLALIFPVLLLAGLWLRRRLQPVREREINDTLKTQVM